jgi:hypothetical protein
LLGLTSVGYTPRLLEAIVRLGALTSFREAGGILKGILHVDVSEATVRRLTQSAGRAVVAEEEREAGRIRKELACPEGEGDRLQQVSVDGAMVPLIHGQFAEVRTLAIATVERTKHGPQAANLTYFSRLENHERFQQLASVEFYRRKTELAKEVVSVNDGAEWIQEFLDEHCPQALRILDWAHASGYLSAAAQGLFGPGTADCAAWLEQQRYALWNGDPQTVVNELERLLVSGVEAVRIAHQYLIKRLDQIRYAGFRARGYPVGSGIVESANKGVVEQRLKGRGRHWAPANVNPILGLRCASASQRWDASWQTALNGMRHEYRPHANRHCSATPAKPPSPPPPVLPGPVTAPPSQPKTVNGIPTIHHPWKVKLRRRPKI